MELIVLGSGTGIPRPHRNAPGYVLSASGLDMLVDCGSGTLRQLARAGRNYTALDAVWLTHLHPDHIGDLLALVHALKFPNLDRTKPLNLYGPVGLMDYFERHIAAITGLPLGFEIRVTEVDEPVTLDGLTVRAVPTHHTEHSLGYRFELGGRALVLTGDTDWDPNLVGLCDRADVVVMDCSFPDQAKVSGHLCPRECGAIAGEARVKCLVLSHIYPPEGLDSDRVAQCRAVFSGRTILAEDFMHIDLSPDPAVIRMLQPV